jgi:uncharacterized protein YndB with AHSA1/START domain
MDNSHIYYTTYILASPLTIWDAITRPEYTEKYFFGRQAESSWEIGSSVRYWQPNRKLAIEGIVIENVYPTLLGMRWRVVWTKKFNERSDAIIHYRIDPLGDVSRVTLTETFNEEMSEEKIHRLLRLHTITLSGMKTLIETGNPLPKFNVMG